MYCVPIRPAFQGPGQCFRQWCGTKGVSSHPVVDSPTVSTGHLPWSIWGTDTLKLPGHTDISAIILHTRGALTAWLNHTACFTSMDNLCDSVHAHVHPLNTCRKRPCPCCPMIHSRVMLDSAGKDCLCSHTHPSCSLLTIRKSCCLSV